MIERVTISELERFVENVGIKRGQRIMNLLGKNQDFVTAISTEVGQELIKDAMNRLEVLLDRIADLNASDEEKMEYKVTKGILEVWLTRITDYNRRIKDIRETIERKGE